MSKAISHTQANFSDLIDTVARELVTVTHDARHSFVSTPLVYPNGTSVVVRIEGTDGEYLVTDFGMGYEEAEMMGAANIYSRCGKLVADAANIGFDNHSFFVLRVACEQLAGAIVTVANCSKEAASVAAYKLADRKNRDAADILYSRLVTVFPKRIVARNVPVIGQSNTEWHVATMVQRDRVRAIFEPVSAHHVSVCAAATKFHDIAAVEDAPSRVAVVKRKSEMKTYLAVLSQASNVIEQSASNDVYSELVEAA